jgi:hypothetical protein
MIGPTALFGIVVTSGSLSPALDLDLPYKPPTPRPRSPSYEKRDPDLVKENVSRVMNLVAALDEIAEFSKKNVETVIGTPLGKPVSHPDGPVDLEANLARGPFHRIVVRHTRPAKAPPGSIVMIDARPGVDLKKSDFPPGYLGSAISFTPDNGDGGTFAYTKESRGKRSVFVFNSATQRFGGALLYRGHALTIR